MSNILILLSKYRQALMGIAILWVMMFHLPLRPGIPIIKEFFNIGYGGVDIFLFLSGFGLYFSLSKKGIKLSHYYKKKILQNTSGVLVISNNHIFFIHGFQSP